MTDTDETKQRKCEEKIRLYTQNGISTTPKKDPKDTNYNKIYQHFSVLSKQNAEITDQTSLTYSEFLKETKGDLTKATEALINWSLQINNDHISDSAVDLILPTVFFETGNVQSTKLGFWKNQIGVKYNTLVEKGKNLWDDGDKIATGLNITPALKRIGMKWDDSRKDDETFVKQYAESLGFDTLAERQKFGNAMFKLAAIPAIEKYYYATATGKRKKLASEFGFFIKNKINMDILSPLMENSITLEEKNMFENFYKNDI